MTRAATSSTLIGESWLAVVLVLSMVDCVTERPYMPEVESGEAKSKVSLPSMTAGSDVGMIA